MLNNCGVIITFRETAILLTVEFYVCPVLLAGRNGSGQGFGMCASIIVYHAGIISFSEGFGGGPVCAVRGVLDLDGVGADLVQCSCTNYLKECRYGSRRCFGAVSPIGRKFVTTPGSCFLGIGGNVRQLLNSHL